MLRKTQGAMARYIKQGNCVVQKAVKSGKVMLILWCDKELRGYYTKVGKWQNEGLNYQVHTRNSLGIREH